MDKRDMKFEDFKYPMKEALHFAFGKTKNVALKLPKNLDIYQKIKDLAEIFTKERNDEEFDIEFIEVKRGYNKENSKSDATKYFYILTGDLVEEY